MHTGKRSVRKKSRRINNKGSRLFLIYALSLVVFMISVLGAQVKEVAEIKKDPAVALAKIKEIEEREKQHGATERSGKRKEELKVF